MPGSEILSTPASEEQAEYAAAKEKTFDAQEYLKQDGPASERVREAYDTLPADSEAEVDYPRPLQLVGQASSLGFELKPELAVEITITTPDGRRFSFSEAVECEDGHSSVNAEIADMIDQVYGAAVQRFADIDG